MLGWERMHAWFLMKSVIQGSVKFHYGFYEPYRDV